MVEFETRNLEVRAQRVGLMLVDVAVHDICIPQRLQASTSLYAYTL